MTICSDTPKPWTICLVKSEFCKQSDLPEEKFFFEDVKVVNEVITGKVFDIRNNQTDLNGTCVPFDHRANVSRMTFFFLAANSQGMVEILLTGWGFEPGGPNALFFGGFLALAPRSDDSSPLKVNLGSGDTGTGTGMQAMLRTQT